MVGSMSPAAVKIKMEAQLGIREKFFEGCHDNQKNVACMVAEFKDHTLEDIVTPICFDDVPDRMHKSEPAEVRFCDWMLEKVNKQSWPSNPSHVHIFSTHCPCAQGGQRLLELRDHCRQKSDTFELHVFYAFLKNIPDNVDMWRRMVAEGIKLTELTTARYNRLIDYHHGCKHVFTYKGGECVPGTRQSYIPYSQWTTKHCEVLTEKHKGKTFEPPSDDYKNLVCELGLD